MLRFVYYCITCTIKNDKDSVQYSQPTSWMVRLSSSLLHQELLDHLYSGIPIDKEKYEIKLRWRSLNLSRQLMQSKYILVLIDDEDVQKILIFLLKFL